MVKIRCSKIKQTKAKIYIPNQLLRKHPLCFSVSPVFSKTFGNRAFCLFVFHQILISSCTIRVRTLFKLVAQIFLNAFTKISCLCCCTVNSPNSYHTCYAEMRSSSCDTCSWNSKCIKNYSLRKTNSTSKSRLGPRNDGWWPLERM